MLYLLCKMFHLLAVISWMAGILYLWRIFVNHRDHGFQNHEINDLLIGMGDRLYRYITRPSMVVSWAFAVAMISQNLGMLSTGWLWVKITCVLGLSYNTLSARTYWKRFENLDESLPEGKFFRVLNEVPTILMIIIVGMVVFKPF